jgi:hypothetical protein
MVYYFYFIRQWLRESENFKSKTISNPKQFYFQNILTCLIIVLVQGRISFFFDFAMVCKFYSR